MTKYESTKTEKGNVGVSWTSQEAADAQAREMDERGNVNCYNCSDCSDCSHCSDCSRCSRCSRCSDCSGVEVEQDAENIGRLSAKLIATQAQAVENLDKVRTIVLDDQKRLQMGHWHADDGLRARTCAEETMCQTTHCLAGWLQVCSTVPEIRNARDAQQAGFFSAPVAAGMFFQPAARVLQWLTDREYDKAE